MSGGRWGYKSHRLDDLALELDMRTHELVEIIKTAAQSEHIVDWAESGDTVRRREDGSGAERDLYDLWHKLFERLYGLKP